MFRYIKSVFKTRTTLVLLFLSLFAILLSGMRVFFTGRSMFLFMLWNLFLAFIPWFLASLIYTRRVKNRWVLAILMLCWTAFFPNAPYILTDLFHLGKGASVPLWYDLILLLSFSFAGLLYGFTSLRMIEKIAKADFPKLPVWSLSVVMIYVSCFGVYLGRYLRWNSWDLVANLGNVVGDVLGRFVSPLDYPRTWAFTLLFGTLLNLVYWGFKVFHDIEKEAEIIKES